MALTGYTEWARTSAGSVVAGVAVEVRRTSDDTLADLYTDATGATPINNGVDFVSDANGRYEFYTEPDRYYILVGAGASQISKPLDLTDGRAQVPFDGRAAFVAWIAGGGTAPDGTVKSDGTVFYIASTGATAISDMPGWLPFGQEYTPFHWGAVGDGSTDDGSAFNLATAAYRAAINAQSDQKASLVFTGLGATFLSSVPIDLTKLQSWGYSVRNFTVHSQATGLIAVETTASRGGHWESVTVYGDETLRPSVGWYAARSAAGGGLGFCDNNYLSNVKTIGYFSVAGAYMYGQETTTYDHCAFWNYAPAGRAGIHIGNDTGVTSVTTTHEAPVTGAVSYINDVYVNCDWRYLPIGRSFSITGITLGNPTVITVSGDPSGLNGDDVTFLSIGGTDELNNLVGTVTAATSTTITVDIDSTAFTAFTSGGTVYGTQDAASVLFGRGSDHSFDGCYAVSYGRPNIEFFFPDSDVPNKNKFEFLYEGAGSAEHFRFNTGGSTRTIGHTIFKTYNTHSRDNIIAAPDGLTWRGGEVVVTNNSRGNPNMFNNLSNFTLYGVDIVDGLDTAVSVAGLAAWSGDYRRADGTNHIIDSFVSAPTSFYPSIDKTTDVGLINRRVRAGYFQDVYLTDGVSYQSGDGVGGSVTQLTSKTTAVTINKVCGIITVNNSALAAGATDVFEVNNSLVTAEDVPLVTVSSTVNSYRVDVLSVSAGRFSIGITNITGGSLSQAFAINFNLGARITAT